MFHVQLIHCEFKTLAPVTETWIRTMQLHIRAWNSNILIAVKYSLERADSQVYLYMSTKMIWLTVRSHRRLWFCVGLVSLSLILEKPSAHFSVNAEIVEPLLYIIHESSLARETNLYVVRRPETASEETASEKTGDSSRKYQSIPIVSIVRESAWTFPTNVGSDAEFVFDFPFLLSL